VCVSSAIYIIPNFLSRFLVKLSSGPERILQTFVALGLNKKHPEGWTRLIFYQNVEKLKIVFYMAQIGGWKHLKIPFMVLKSLVLLSDEY